MIIQCPECQARFKLADEKIKPEGTKVRCSKCQHIFTVTPPEPEPAPEFDETPEETSPASQPSGPKIDVDFSAFGAEEDWNNFGEATSSEEQTEQESEEFSIGGPDPEQQEEQPFSFGDTDENSAFSSEGGPDSSEDYFASEPESTAFETESTTFETETSETDFGFGESDSDADSFFSDESETESASNDSISFSDDFSEAKDDDFAWEEETTSSGPNEFDFEDSAPLPALDDDFAHEEPAAEESASDEFQFKEMSFDDEAPAETAPEKGVSAEKPKAGRKDKKRAKKKQYGQRKSPLRGLMIFILLLLLALSAGAGYVFWSQGNLDLTRIIEQVTGQSAPPQPAGQIQVTDLTSSFVNNADAGQLFIIHGKAVNQFKEARSAIAVKGILYGKGGKQLLQQTVFCGNRLDSAKLQSWSFAKIEEAMNNQFGDSLSNLNVAPGASIPFTIVFKNLPKDLNEFTVEVADSKPGSKQ